MSAVARFSFPLFLAAAALALSLPLEARAAQIDIGMGHNFFTIPSVTINAGDTVVWTNSDTVAHTVTGSGFDSGNMNPGATFSHTFTTAGTFSYQCIYHSGMTGTVIVKAPTQTTTVSGPPNPYASTGVTTGSNVSTLQAQVQALLTQIASIQAKYGLTTASSAGSCPALPRSLKLGMEGADVTALQQFLAANPSIYPEGKVTGYFGALTQSAVQRWQAANGIISSGTPDSTGYGVVGPRTIAAIASRCSNTGGTTVSTPTTAGSSDDLGAFMKVTPITGFAPLATNIQVTVNTTNSCLAAIYTLDFGDGSSVPIPAAQGICQPQSVTITHTYTYAGVYQVKLSVGTHSTYTIVSVSGTASPVATAANSAGVSQQSVDMLDNTFSPVTLTVAPGTIVTWKNASALLHTVTADNGAFDSGTLQPNQTYSLRFEQVGEFPYYCKFHGVPGGRGGMAGKIIVSGSAPTTQSTSASSANLALSKSGLKATASFTTKGKCDSYAFDWGDDSSNVYRWGDGSTCANPENVQLTHTYEKAGTYTVTLMRGAALLDSTEATITVQ